ncbi:MAG TPA: UDP-N-acetylglucosamine diphosphorylase/glucosamine-1-phosphate N-acetyltransferase [Oceanospirillaceae bacterium]|nr:UDP-N-acetylglucosamine diphosphorylase/glucosamine-1-phosphate N-acetyltransferase [Oceanospirillaceae bacterium]
MGVEAIILAAGQGTRMRSKLPKVLHTLAGKPLVTRLAETTSTLDLAGLHVVVGHAAKQVSEAVAHLGAQCHVQAEQKGTGHAFGIASEHVADDSILLLMYADSPLIPAEVMQQMVDQAQQDKLVMLTVTLDNPTGFGRILRNHNNQVQAIVEHKDATPEQLAIGEINTGVYALPAKRLKEWLPRLDTNNAQGELYVTDIVEFAVADGVDIKVVQPPHIEQALGVNDRIQLAELERWYQQYQATELMRNGVRVADPTRIDVRGELTCGEDVAIDINCVFEGCVKLGDDVVIGPNCTIKDATVGAGTVIKANSVIEGAVIAEQCDIGPFARLRLGTELANKAKVGNFVETKKTYLGEGSKANHFTYLGDSDVGAGVNIGAGTITCNYDGVNKFQTRIEDGVFVGSNSSLVAPLIIGAGATVGAGSTITKDIPAQHLAVARGKQRNMASWTKPVKIDK